MVEDVFVEAFFVEDDVWFDNATAFGAVWDLVSADNWCNLVVGVASVATGAVVYKWAAVDVIDILRAGALVQHVYILGIEGFEVAFLLKEGQTFVYNTGLVVFKMVPDVFGPFVEDFWILSEKTQRDYLFHVHSVPWVRIYAVGPSKVWNMA